jgi:hypothetical protein
VIFHKIPFVLPGVENALAQEGEASPAVAHAFHQFQLVHFSLNQTI